jgi:DNA mismatch endonuclease, patch repair protein
MGFRFRIASSQKLLGKPDIVLRRHRAAIFVHGCFWHRHDGCKLCYTPKSRIEFWQKKFDANVARDHLVRRTLRSQGWQVIVAWECEVTDPNALKRRFSRLLKNRQL